MLKIRPQIWNVLNLNSDQLRFCFLFMAIFLFSDVESSFNLTAMMMTMRMMMVGFGLLIRYFYFSEGVVKVLSFLILSGSLNISQNVQKLFFLFVLILVEFLYARPRLCRCFHSIQIKQNGDITTSTCVRSWLLLVKDPGTLVLPQPITARRWKCCFVRSGTERSPALRWEQTGLTKRKINISKMTKKKQIQIWWKNRKITI